MSVKFYGRIISDPQSRDYGKVVSLGRTEIDLPKSVFVSERFAEGEWIDDIDLFGKISGIVAGGLDWHEIKPAQAQAFQNGERVVLTFGSVEVEKTLARQLKQQHMGPGDHPSGSPQSVHGKEGPRDAGGPNPIPPGTAKAIDDLLEEVRQGKRFGFSYRPMTGNAPQSGYMSSVSDGPIFSPDLSRDERESVIQDYLDEKRQILGEDDIYVGGWLNEDDGMFYLDASRNYQDIYDTMYDAADTKQKSVFDVKAEDIVWVSDWLEAHPEFDAPPGSRSWYAKNKR